MKKYLVYFSLQLAVVLVSIGWATGCQAAMADGACGPTSGQTAENYQFAVNTTITDPNDNKVGALPSVTKSAGGTFSLTCQCDPVVYPAGFQTHQWTTSPLDVYTTANGLTFYNINEYIAAAVEIRDEGNKNYYPTPWDNHFMPSSPATMSCGQKLTGFNTGNNVRVTFYIKHPFVGQVTIPSTLISQLWYTVSDTFVPGQPTALISISGNISVPESCEINSGQMLTVDLGNVWASSFKTPGQKPNGYAPQTVSIPVQCNDMASTAALQWRMIATPSTEYPDAIQSSNSGIGVVVANMQGTVITPETGSIPLVLDNNYATTVNIQAWPVKVINGTPEAGNYSAVATMRIDFQ